MSKNRLKGVAVSFLALALFLFSIPVTVLATDVCGPIGVDTTWTLAGSPYIVTCGVLVMHGVTLTIEPGVAVKFAAQTALQINGELNAIGTEGSMITFTSNTSNAGSPAPGDWGYIKFSDSSVDASFSGETYLDGCILEYCTVKYAGYDDRGGVWVDYSAPYINYSTIQKCSTSGIKATDSTGVRITNNTIYNNYGGGIYTYYGTVIIANNDIVGNSASDGGGIFTRDGTVTIADNYIVGNSAADGGGIFTRDGTVTIADNYIVGNSAADDGGGIYADYYWSWGTATIADNSIIDNYSGDVGAGIYFDYGDATIANNTLLNNTSASPDASSAIYIWSGNPTTINDNNLVNNSDYELYNSNSYGSPNIDAKNNWWGTAVESVIQAKIYDWFDNASKGIVDYSPWLIAWGTEAPPPPPESLVMEPAEIKAESFSVNLSWNAVPVADLAGYKVYCDTNGGHPYAQVIDAGNVTSYTLTNLDPARTYYITVAAYDTGCTDGDPKTECDQSWYSNEVRAAAPGTLPAITISTDQPSYATGDTMEVTLEIIAGSAPTTADLYIRLRLPNGAYRYYPSMSSSPKPVKRSWTVTDFGPAVFFSYTFGGGAPSGGYIWQAALTEPGTSTLIGKLSAAPFTFSP